MTEKKGGVRGGGKGQNRGYHDTGRNTRFRAPTAGYKNVVFRVGDSPAIFNRCADKLADYVGTSFKDGGPAMAQELSNMSNQISHTRQYQCVKSSSMTRTKTTCSELSTRSKY